MINKNIYYIIMKNPYLKSIIYGGTDGIVTLFNIISGVEGAKLNHSIIFIIGIGTLIADAVSMGFSDFISSEANNQYKEHYNIDNKNPNPKKSGLVTFLSFLIFGSIPLITYIIFSKYSKYKYINTLLSTIVALFILGSIQSIFTKQLWYKSGLNVSLYGLLASIISYSFGKLMSSFVPSNIKI